MNSPVYVDRRAVARMLTRYVELRHELDGVRSPVAGLVIHDSRIPRDARKGELPPLDDVSLQELLDAVNLLLLRRKLYAQPEIRKDLLFDDGTPIPSALSHRLASHVVRVRPSRYGSAAGGSSAATWLQSVGGILGHLPADNQVSVVGVGELRFVHVETTNRLKTAKRALNHIHSGTGRGVRAARERAREVIARLTAEYREEAAAIERHSRTRFYRHGYTQLQDLIGLLTARDRAHILREKP